MQGFPIPSPPESQAASVRAAKRLKMTVMDAWTDCDLVERVAGKQDGVPLIKQTRIPAQQIVEEFHLGSSVTEIARNYPSLTLEQIKGLITFNNEHQPQPVL